MRNSVMLAVGGLVLVVVGVGFAERSWGWTVPLAVIGAALLVAAGLRVVRGVGVDGRVPR